MGISVEWFGEISADLGVSRPALYNYVVDRDDLAFKCYSRTCDHLESSLRIATTSGGDPADVIERFLIEAARSDTPEAAVLSEIDALSPDKQVVIRGRRDAVVAALATTIRRGVKQHQFRSVDAVIAANAIIGMISWPALYRRWAANSDLVLTAAGMKEILFSGLAADRRIVLNEAIDLMPPSRPKVDLFDRRALDGARREAIILSASDLFNRRGIGATRVEDVGAAVGLSKRAIFHHIGAKDALVDACVERSIDFHLGVMAASEGLQATRLEAYAAGVKTGVEVAGDPERSVLVPYVGFGLLSPGSQQAMHAFSQRLTEGYRKMLDDGMREGSIRALPREEVLASLPGLFSWVSTSAFGTSGNRSKVARELAGLIAKGMLI